MDGRRKSLGQGAREARQFECRGKVGKEQRMKKAMSDGLKRRIDRHRRCPLR